MNISWMSWNLLAAILLAILYLLVFHMLRRWETEDTRATLRNRRVAIVTFGGLPLLAYELGSIACMLGNPIAVASGIFAVFLVHRDTA
jgi:hypothetical protein